MGRESLFQSHEDYLNWDKYIENCEFLEGLDGLQKKAAKEALAYLRGFLLRPHFFGLGLIPGARCEK